MAPISEETWKNIIRNQEFPLFGTNKPNEGNGYNDSISWRINFRPKKEIDENLYSSSFFTIYLRDLSLLANPDSYSRKELFDQGMIISDCSQNYQETLSKYITNNRHYRSDDILYQLGHWGEYLCRKGLVIFELVGWYDNKTSQFYAFNLNMLDIDYCTINKDHIIYSAPFNLDEDNKEIFKKVLIPKSKCLIIEFPKEFGGYNGFKEKVRKVLKLGYQHILKSNSAENLAHYKNWDREFFRIINDWGASQKQENITEFYQEINAFRFTYLARLCTLELIAGLNQLLTYLNNKLDEKASLELKIERYDMDYFKEMQIKWTSGDLSFDEANKFLRP